MSLFTTSLNSGSNGNCYYIGNQTEAVLIDAGLSCRETEKRMLTLGLSLKMVKAIFISHEHSDHIKGVQVLAEKYDIPVHISYKTSNYSGFKLKNKLVKHFTANEPVCIGNLAVTAFPKFHDAADPHSFIICSNGITVGVFTDIGKPCDRLLSHFTQCHAAYLESNYDDDMLEHGRYPLHLKNRIRGGSGHLSNSQALQVFKIHKPAFMTHLFLSHLSRDNNSPELVQQLFSEHAGNTKIIIASRFEPTAIFTIQQTTTAISRKPIQVPTFRPEQLSLF